MATPSLNIPYRIKNMDIHITPPRRNSVCQNDEIYHSDTVLLVSNENGTVEGWVRCHIGALKVHSWLIIFVSYGWWATRSRREKRTLQAVIFCIIVLCGLILSLSISYEEMGNTSKHTHHFQDPDDFPDRPRELIMNTHFHNRWRSRFPSTTESTTRERVEETPPMYPPEWNQPQTSTERMAETTQMYPPAWNKPWTTTERMERTTRRNQTPWNRPQSTSATTWQTKPWDHLQEFETTASIETRKPSTEKGSTTFQPTTITESRSPSAYTSQSTSTPQLTSFTPFFTTPSTTPTTTPIFTSRKTETPGRFIPERNFYPETTTSRDNFQLGSNLSRSPEFNTTVILDSVTTTINPFDKRSNETTMIDNEFVPTSATPVERSTVFRRWHWSDSTTKENFLLNNKTSSQPESATMAHDHESNTTGTIDHTLSSTSPTSTNIRTTTLKESSTGRENIQKQRNDSLFVIQSTVNVTSISQVPETSTISINPTDVPVVNVCLEDECLLVANNLQMSIDENTKPCDNFYQHVCGNWKKTTTSPSMSVGISGVVLSNRIKEDIKNLLIQEPLQYDSKAVKNIKTLYRSCVDRVVHKKISMMFLQRTLSTLTSIAQNKGRNTQGRDLSRLIIQLIPLYSNYLLPIGIKKDIKDVSKNILHIGINPLQLLYKKNYNPNLPFFAALHTLVNKIANEMQVQSIVEKVIGFELLISQITPDTIDQNSISRYNPISIKELEKSTEISWRRIFQTAINLTGQNVTIRDDELVIVESFDYLKKLLELLRGAEEHDLINFVLMRFVMSKIDAMPNPFYTMYQQYKKVISGINNDNRQLSCVLFVGNMIPSIVGKIYADRYFSEADKYKNIHVPKMIHAAVIDMVPHLHWMDQFTKWEGLKKLYAMLQMIGSDDSLDGNSLLEQFQFSENFMSNLFALDKYQLAQTFTKLRVVNSRGKWSMASHPFEVKSSYTPRQNAIYIPAAMFQQPLFHDDLPLIMQFGALGSVVGHAYIHSLDLQGSKFDENGNMRNWWSKKTRRNFLSQVQSITTDTFKVLKMQDILESSADIGGMKIALRAYNKMVQEFNLVPTRLPGLNYTSQQLFYISYAQAWCDVDMMKHAMDNANERSSLSGKTRVTLTLQNSQEFSNTFQCKPGLYMNPRHKTNIW